MSVTILIQDWEKQKFQEKRNYFDLPNMSDDAIKSFCEENKSIYKKDSKGYYTTVLKSVFPEINLSDDNFEAVADLLLLDHSSVGEIEYQDVKDCLYDLLIFLNKDCNDAYMRKLLMQLIEVFKTANQHKKSVYWVERKAS